MEADLVPRCLEKGCPWPGVAEGGVCAMHWRDQHEWELEEIVVPEPADRDLDSEDRAARAREKMKEFCEQEKREAEKWKLALQQTGWAVFARPGRWKSRAKGIRFGWVSEPISGNHRKFEKRGEIEVLLKEGLSIREVVRLSKTHRNTVLGVRRRLEAAGVKFRCLKCGSLAHRGGGCARKKIAAEKRDADYLKLLGLGRAQS